VRIMFWSMFLELRHFYSGQAVQAQRSGPELLLLLEEQLGRQTKWTEMGAGLKL
jgi:hypothetical protein